MELMAKKDFLRLLFCMLCTEYIYIYILFFGGMKRGGRGEGGWDGMVMGNGMRNDARKSSNPPPLPPPPPPHLSFPFRLYITVHSDDLLGIKFFC